MMLQFSTSRAVPGSAHLSIFDRNFMRIDLRRAALPEGRLRRTVSIGGWTDLHQEPAAELIANAYKGHVDSSINDQYRTAIGARRFFHNIVQYPGCGTFFRPASFAAFEPSSSLLCGISLTSLVSQDFGHITQICVSPEVKVAAWVMRCCANRSSPCAMWDAARRRSPLRPPMKARSNYTSAWASALCGGFRPTCGKVFADRAK